VKGMAPRIRCSRLSGAQRGPRYCGEEAEAPLDCEADAKRSDALPSRYPCRQSGVFVPPTQI
jgi:hypothetical protein